MKSLIDIAKQPERRLASALAARDLAQLQRQRLLQETRRTATSPAALIGAFGGGLAAGLAASRPKKIIVTDGELEAPARRAGGARRLAISVTKRLIKLRLLALAREIFAN